MNDEHLLNEEQLRLATSRELPADSALDTEIAAMREGFVGLGRSLEMAGGPLDEARLVARLRKVAIEEPGADQFSRRGAEAQGVRLRETRSADSGFLCALAPLREIFAGDWSVVVSVALAVVALIAIVRIGGEWRRGEGSAMALAKASGDVTQIQSDAWESAPQGVDWNDPLDDEIALAAATMGQFSAGSRGVDDSLFDMNQELFLLSQELAGESL